MKRRVSPISAISTVILDCDGVLFESRAANIAYHNTILRQLGQPPLNAREERLSYVFSTRELYSERFPDDPFAVERAVAAARATDYGPFYELMEPPPCLESVLGRLKARYILAVASNRGRSLRGVLRHFKLERHFDLSASTNEVERPKPHPDLILYCVHRLGMLPAQAVYVGDTATDRLAAEAAGVHFIGVGPESGASLVVGRLEELPGRLETLG